MWHENSRYQVTVSFTQAAVANLWGEMGWWNSRSVRWHPLSSLVHCPVNDNKKTWGLSIGNHWLMVDMPCFLVIFTISFTGGYKKCHLGSQKFRSLNKAEIKAAEFPYIISQPLVWGDDRLGLVLDLYSSWASCIAGMFKIVSWGSRYFDVKIFFLGPRFQE